MTILVTTGFGSGGLVAPVTGVAPLPFQADNILAYYKFWDGSWLVKDTTGSANTAAWVQDLSGNGNHLYADSKVNQPRLWPTSGGSAETWGVHFSETNFLRLVSTAGFLRNLTGGYTFHALFNQITNSSDRIVMWVSQGSSATNRRASCYLAATTLRNKFRGSVGDGTQVSVVASATSLSSGVPGTLQQDIDLANNTVKFYDNNVLKTTTTSAFAESPQVTPDTDPLVVSVGNEPIGFTQPLNGYLSVLVVTAGPMATGQQGSIYTYMNTEKTTQGIA